MPFQFKKNALKAGLAFASLSFLGVLVGAVFGSTAAKNEREKQTVAISWSAPSGFGVLLGACAALAIAYERAPPGGFVKINST